MKQGLFILGILLALLSGCKDSHHFNGYIDADLTYLSSDFSGRVKSILIKRGQFAHKDELLFTVEKTSERLGNRHENFSRKNLITQKKVILEQINYNQRNYQRMLTMHAQNAASQNDVDLAKEQLDIANDQLEGIEFQISASKALTDNWLWQMNRKQNIAIDNGIVYDTYYTLGEYVSAGQPILSLITESNIKVIFFVPEEDLSSLKIGQKIRAFTNKNISVTTAAISYISNEAQYTNPIIYSREEREKLVYRVEARLSKPKLETLHLGQPVTIELIP